MRKINLRGMDMKYLIKAIEKSSMTEAEICDVIGIKVENWKRKLRGELEFTVSDILKLRKVLSLTDRETELIFLTEFSHKMQKEE